MCNHNRDYLFRLNTLDEKSMKFLMIIFHEKTKQRVLIFYTLKTSCQCSIIISFCTSKKKEDDRQLASEREREREREREKERGRKEKNESIKMK